MAHFRTTDNKQVYNQENFPLSLGLAFPRKQKNYKNNTRMNDKWVSVSTIVSSDSHLRTRCFESFFQIAPRKPNPRRLDLTTMAPTADTPCGAGDPDPLGVESLIVVPPPDPNMSRGTSSRRPLWSRRGFDISPVPSPLIRSKQGERYRDHQHHRAPDENIRSPRFYSPLRRSKSVPFPKRSRLEDGRKGSSSGGYGYSNRMYESLYLYRLGLSVLMFPVFREAGTVIMMKREVEAEADMMMVSTPKVIFIHKFPLPHNVTIGMSVF